MLEVSSHYCRILNFLFNLFFQIFLNQIYVNASSNGYINIKRLKKSSIYIDIENECLLLT